MEKWITELPGTTCEYGFVKSLRVRSITHNATKNANNALYARSFFMQCKVRLARLSRYVWGVAVEGTIPVSRGY